MNLPENPSPASDHATLTSPDVAALVASIPVLSFRELASTSGLARKLAESGQLRGRPAIVVADSQSAGVGRFQRRWASPIGGLWYTLAWPLRPEPEARKLLDGLGLRVGLACTKLIIAKVAQAKRRPDVRLKWPNDVLVNDMKVAGVLCELIHVRAAIGEQRCVLIGVGINANLSAALLPTEVRHRACGLLDHVGLQLDLVQLRIDLTTCLVEMLLSPGLPPTVLDEARRLLWGVGKETAVALPGGGKIVGMLVGIDDKGLAVIKTEDGIFNAPPGTMLMNLEPPAGAG